jgi:hypothetical protein
MLSGALWEVCSNILINIDSSPADWDQDDCFRGVSESRTSGPALTWAHTLLLLIIMIPIICQVPSQSQEGDSDLSSS